MGNVMIVDWMLGGALSYLQTVSNFVQVSAATLQAVLFRCHEGWSPDIFAARLALRQKSCEAKVGELPGGIPSDEDHPKTAQVEFLRKETR